MEMVSRETSKYMKHCIIVGDGEGVVWWTDGGKVGKVTCSPILEINFFGRWQLLMDRDYARG